jgi:hypothetical protein
MPPTNATRPAPALAGSEPRKSDRRGGTICSATSKHRAANQELIAAIDTGHASHVRVQLYRWRDQTKIELKPYSATVPKCFMPCGPGVSLNVEHLPELIAALEKAKGALP